MTSNREIKCPRCGAKTVYSVENPHRPFCSDRCKLIDLGDWATEKFAIPVQDQNVEQDLEDKNPDEEGDPVQDHDEF